MKKIKGPPKTKVKLMIQRDTAEKPFEVELTRTLIETETVLGVKRKADDSWDYWVDPDNNHCFLTPRLARSAPGCRFNIFWEADFPVRPDPYLSNLDLTTIGMGPETSDDTMTKRSAHLRIVK